MSFGLIIGEFNSSLMEKRTINAIVECNSYTENFGLSLTPEQALQLVETRSVSLKATGRIEFGTGIIDKLVKEFCDSPYISMRNYTEIINELIEMFYYYKNETLDLMSDDELIGFMKKAFDGVCQGSIELLSGRELSNMAHNLRFYNNPYHIEEIDIPDEDEEEDEYGEYS